MQKLTDNSEGSDDVIDSNLTSKMVDGTQKPQKPNIENAIGIV